MKGVQLPLPSVRLAVLQILVSALGLGAGRCRLLRAAAARAAPRLSIVLGAFLAAQILGLAAHVPGGVGVFEGVIVLLLKPYPRLGAAGAGARRLPGHLLPGTAVGRAHRRSSADEVQRRRGHAARITAYIGRMTEQLTPRILALFTFIAGVVLLCSGATPAAANRLALLERVVPLGVIETSHIIGSVPGALLLLLSQGLARRLDAAYYLTMGAVTAGIAASLLKGADYEEALALGVLLLVLRRARPAFDRRAAFFATRFSPAWMSAVAAALVASVWLGLFAFKHVEYSHDLWWQFELDGEASRFLRGSVGAATAVLLFCRGAAHRTRAARGRSRPRTRICSPLARSSPDSSATYPHLVYLRDKAILFDEPARGLRDVWRAGPHLGRARRSGRAATPHRRSDSPLHRALRRLRRHAGVLRGGQAVPASLRRFRPRIHQAGRGGAGRSRRSFTLDGSDGARFRQVMRRLEKDGVRLSA